MFFDPDAILTQGPGWIRSALLSAWNYRLAGRWADYRRRMGDVRWYRQLMRECE